MMANFENFKVNAVYTGSKKAEWGNNNNMPENWNHHRVTVTNTNNKKHTSFDFWGSIVNPELNTEYDVLNAFNCFISDAMAGMDSFEEFCGNFGYDTDSRTAERTYKACQKSTDKLERIYDGDIYDLANRLNEIAG